MKCGISSGSSLFAKSTHLGVSGIQRANHLGVNVGVG